MVVLDGLEKIPWDTLEQAYGDASEVPEWMRTLASGDESARRQVLGAIEASLNHQGFITPAGVEVVPFLIQIFDAGIERAALAILIADMSVGGFHGMYAVEGFSPVVLLDEWLAMRAAVVATHPRFASLLHDPHAGVRSAGAVALGVIPERLDEGRSALRARIAQESQAAPLACMVLALALLDRGAAADAAGSLTTDLVTFRTLTAHRSEIVVLAARIAIAQLEPTTDNALEALCAAEGRPECERNVPWNAGQLVDLAQQMAIDAVQRAGDVDALAGFIDVLGFNRVVPATLALLLGPSGIRRPAEPRALEDLPARARAFLEVVGKNVAKARAKDPWFVDPSPLSLYGICDVARLTGATPSRPLDEAFEGEPRWRIARRVGDGRAPQETWTACLRVLTADQIEDVVRDLAITQPIPYELMRDWPEGKWGYDAEIATWVRYNALTGDAARLLGSDRLERLMEWLLANPRNQRIAPIVDAYTASLQRPLDARFDRVVRTTLEEIDSDGRYARSILARVPMERREALVSGLDFNVCTNPKDASGHAVYFRIAWHCCALVPTEAIAKQAAARLVKWRLLHAEGSEGLGPELIAGLTSRFRPFGAAGRAALEDVLRAPGENEAILRAVLAALTD